MQKINSGPSLREAILQLESRQAAEGVMVKEHFLTAYESVKPVNLILSTFKEIIGSRDLKDNLINTSVGLATGYASKLIFERGTHNPIRKLMGNAIMFGIIKMIAQNPETVKAMGKGILKMIGSKHGSRVHSL